MKKWRNRPVTVDGIKHASKREAARYQELRLLEVAGIITGLRRQVPFVLAEGVRIQGETRKRPDLRYYADFVYTEVVSRAAIVEDAKGKATREYRIKKHLMKSVLGIDITEV